MGNAGATGPTEIGRDQPAFRFQTTGSKAGSQASPRAAENVTANLKSGAPSVGHEGSNPSPGTREACVSRKAPVTTG